MKNLCLVKSKWLSVIVWSYCVCLGWGQVKAIDAQATLLGSLQKILEDFTSSRVRQSPAQIHANAFYYTKKFEEFLGENEKLFKQISKEKLTETLVAWLSDPYLHKRQIALIFSKRLSKDKRVEVVNLTKSRIAAMKSSTIKLERENGSLIVREYQKPQLLLHYVVREKEPILTWGQTTQKKSLDSLLVDK